MEATVSKMQKAIDFLFLASVATALKVAVVLLRVLRPRAH